MTTTTPPPPSSRKHSTGCIVVGGGPGGLFLSLLLARQGIDVTLLEAHHDFDRDFRGDTIHPTTLELVHQLGLSRSLHQLPHSKLTQFRIHTPSEHYTIADLSVLPTRFPYIMLAAQAEFLAFLAAHGRRYPNLHVRMGAQAHDLIRAGGTVTGVVFKEDDGEHEIRAPLVVGADGRFSKLRKLAGLEPVRTAPPMDVVWFRLPRLASDPSDQGLTVGHGRFCVLLDRGDSWQVGFVIPKGGYQELRKAGFEAFRREVTDIVPWLGDRLQAMTDWHGMTLLSVESSRLRRWYVPGLLLIGDAAHVMSPVGGVGINYAIQDAVATANLLAEPLRQNKVEIRDLAAVQRRREWPVRLIQFVQGMLQRNLVAEALDGGKPFRVPLMLRLLMRLPVLREMPGRLIGLGFGRERARRARPGM